MIFVLEKRLMFCTVLTCQPGWGCQKLGFSVTLEVGLCVCSLAGMHAGLMM